MKRILLTGACGFLGWNLSLALRMHFGHDAWILGIDDLSTGVRRRREHCTMLDIRDVRAINPDLVGNFDYVLHFACPATPAIYQQDPLRTIETNVLGLLNCERYTRDGGTLMFASTSEIYGSPLVHPQPETYWGNVNPNGPRACYDESKRLGETIMLAIEGKGRIKTRLPRLFNTFGPGMTMNDGRVVSNFIMQALLGQEMTVYGDGTQTRSLSYVSDTVSTLMTLLVEPHNIYTPVNIGGDEEVTVMDICSEVRMQTGAKSRIKFMPLPMDDPEQRRPNLTRAQTHLGHKITVPWQKGIGLTINYFRELMACGY